MGKSSMNKETLSSPLEGTICNIKVGPEDHVYAGQTLLGIRDNQMLHLITAQAEADVDRLLVNEGQFVQSGQPLMAIHEGEASKPSSGVEGDPEDATTWKLV